MSDNLASPVVRPSDFARPYPSRRAAEALRERIIEQLGRGPARPGDPFLTDAALVRHTGLSRSTVRRALDGLAREGWVRREIGRGTFVGPRAAGDAAVELPANPRTARATIRLAVSVFYEERGGWDWYTQRVLAGVEQLAEEHRVRVEILGTPRDDPLRAARRLRQSPPDVLACLSSDLHHMMILRDAEELGVPRVLVGGHFVRLPGPVVCEDNVQGTRLAVKALRAAGHRRLAMALPRWPGEWVFERHATFTQLTADDDGTACFLGPTSLRQPSDRDVWERLLDALGEELMRHLDRHQPTALVAGNFSTTEVVGRLARRGRLRVPEDLSLICFDQHPDAAAWLNTTPTTVALPLIGYGRHVAAAARALADGGEVPSLRRLPFELLRGRTVRDLRKVDGQGTHFPRTPLQEENE